MELNMPKTGKKLSTNQLMLATLAAGVATGAVVGGVFGKAETLSPVAAIAVVAAFGISLITWQIWFLLRTDEHDRYAHLWSGTWAWLSIAVMAPSWWLLNKAGVLPAPDALQIFLASAVVGVAAWTWMRFR